jgi:hypothetical protein
MHEFYIRKNGKVWTVGGLIGMTDTELDNAAGQVLSQQDLVGDIVLQISTRKGVERWSITDFSNSGARSQLLQRL